MKLTFATIQEIAHIRFGIHAVPREKGNVLYLQVRQFDDEGRLISGAEEYISYDEKSADFLLKDGDVLFVGKGNRLFAWCYREEYGPAVASSIFFVIRLKQGANIHPEYLTAILNTPQNRSVFRQLGGGTNIFSIRKSELGALEIAVPALKRQLGVVAFTNAYLEKNRLLQEMIRQNKELYKVIMSKIIR